MRSLRSSWPTLMKTTTSTANPLLSFCGLPQFGRVRPEHVRPALDHILRENRAQLEELFSKENHYTWETFVQPIEDMQERLSKMWSPVSHLNAVKNNEPLRKVYNEGLPLISEYVTELGQDERTWGFWVRVRQKLKANHFSLLPDFIGFFYSQKVGKC